MSIEKRRDGYCVRWRDSGGRARSKQVRLWRDAVTLDGEMKRKKAMGELITHERGKITLEDFWEVWWKNHASVNLAASSRDTYGRLWRKHIKPAFGRSSLTAITSESLAHWLSELSKTLASSSVWKCHAVLHSVLTAAVRWSYISTNPSAGLKRPKLVSRRGRALTTEQLDALISELPNLRSQCFVRALAWTGMRPGELRTRRWEDLGPGLIFVEAPKTNTSRSVELVSQGRKALYEWFVACGQPAPHDLIFGPWSANAYRLWQRKVFTPAAGRAGLKGLVPYDLRHTAASRMIAEGQDVLYVARQLGHAPEITLRTYAHEFEVQRKSVYSECPAKTDVLSILRADGGI